jgi:dephospho-CoA kinase
MGRVVKPAPPSGGSPGAAAVLRVGLTGGIATGKSVVAEVFRSGGAFVLDADALGHEMIEPGTGAHEEIREAFGDGILGPGGRIDRKKLGSRVFAEPEARSRLNAILHPRILEEADRRIRAFVARGAGGIAVVQAALLVEAGVEERFDRIVVTHCPRAVQVRRLVDRDRIGEEEALRRITAQAAPEARLRHADHVIDTSGTLEETRRLAREVFAKLEREREAREGPAGSPEPGAR